MIELLSAAILISLFGGIVLISRKLTQPAVTAPSPSKAIGSVSGHKLVKTYVSHNESGDPWIDGWRFKCSCGAKGPANNLVQATAYGTGGKLGTETSAIDKFKLHRDAYLDANGDDFAEHEDTTKLRKLEEEFAEWRKACYCKDTNDDLLLLKHRHLDNATPTTVV